MPPAGVGCRTQSVIRLVPVSSPTSGLTRVTIRAPRRRVDLCLPRQLPLAEFLPDIVLRSGEGEPETAAPPGGWLLRRSDGRPLAAEHALAHQDVRDGDVLYLVPGHLAWPEPDYDDVVEQIAATAREQGRVWDQPTSRVASLATGAVTLMAGLVTLLVASPTAGAAGLVAAGLAVVLLASGVLISRAWGDGAAGAAAGGAALPYAAVAGLFLAGGPSRVGADHLLIAAAAVLLTAVAAMIGIGVGRRFFVAAALTGAGGVVAALLAFALTPSGAAAIVVIGSVAGINLIPHLATRLGRLPVPVVSADPSVIAAEARPSAAQVRAAVTRAEDLLAGTLWAVSALVFGGVVVLSSAVGWTDRLLAGLAAGALVLRSRLFPALSTRLPVLTAGVIGLSLAVARSASPAGPAAALIGVAALAFTSLIFFAVATRRSDNRSPSPYLGRLADAADVVTLIALIPVAFAVLDLYRWAQGVSS